MSDLKQFLEAKAEQSRNIFEKGKHVSYFERGKLFISQEKLGLFFWLRGGKQFVEDVYWLEDKNDNIGVVEIPTFRQILRQAKEDVKDNTDQNALDFLDALACLGEEKVKELISEATK